MTFKHEPTKVKHLQSG